MKKTMRIGIAGMSSLLLALVGKLFFHEYFWDEFLSGLFLGLSLVFNTYFLLHIKDILPKKV